MRAATKCERLLRIAIVSAIAVACTALPASAASGEQGKIAFASDRSGSWQVYIMNPDGSDISQLTNLPPTGDDGLFPSMSPDGQEVLFNYNSGQGPDLFIVNVDGTNLRQLTTDHGSFLGHWSPDGHKIAFSNISNFGTAVITTMAADGSGPKQGLTSNLWDSVAPIYTPDGRRIVFQSQTGGYVSAVWIMNTDGSHARRLTAAALKGAPSSISPDGKHILLINNLNSPPALPNENFVMNLDGSGLKPLAPRRQFHHDLYPTYSPDGSKISFVSDRFSSDITEFTYGTFDILTMDANGRNILDVLSGAGFCPNDGNCVTASWGESEDQ